MNYLIKIFDVLNAMDLNDKNYYSYRNFQKFFVVHKLKSRDYIHKLNGNDNAYIIEIGLTEKY